MIAAIYYLLVINCLTFIIFAVDKLKSKSKNARRTKEKTLLIFTALGGSVGAISAMQIFRHKTRKYQFNTLVYIYLLIHIAITLLVAKQYI